MMKFLDFTVTDFEESKEIDLESFIFFQTILFRKVGKIHIDLSEEKILELKTKDLTEFPDEEQDLARIMKLIGTKFQSEVELYHQLRNQSAQDIDLENLPHYLFLGHRDTSFCLEIEKKFGIHCYSIGRMKVGYENRMATLHKISNTKDKLFRALSKDNFNKIRLEDPYFFTTFTNEAIDKDLVNHLFQLDGYFLGIVKLEIQASLKEITLMDYKKRNGIFEEICSHHLHVSRFKITYSSSLQARHDRYIVSNRSIFIIGNSLFKNAPTHFTSYPIGIYYDYFD